MNNSAIPSRLTVVFSASGDKNTIPVNSTSETLADGLAAMDSGFPPLTRIALSAGGKPPKGQDFNGIFNDVYTRLQWSAAGMGYPFNADFRTAISGYPKGALIPSSDYSGQWLNLNNANNLNPESPYGEPTGWVPQHAYGITSITGLSSSNITLSSLQAAKERIFINGALTANINIIFPSWIKEWVIHNNCTGNFTVTCRTSSGNGVVVTPGTVSRIFCDGINIIDEAYIPGQPGDIKYTARSTAPTGWLKADGDAVSRTTYAALFAAIGTTFGAGDGSTTFNLPDLRGEFIRGWDDGRGVDASRTFGSAQKGTIVGAKDDNNDDANASFLAKGSTVDYGSDGVLFADYPGISAYYLNLTEKTAITSAGQNQFFSVTRPRNVALLACIKY
ncbi:tail fiber protein [Klebsiella quasipneumoniae subsp. quasipneumoniae]|uniref:phage tail protein n=1 Tax=Klebsiella quasipneumoniae TaxID=1463165 RepID=UPI00217CF42B|nr:phage tail protein [Klebsiella quasipneumoniae]MCS5748470.1 tail fiber protein [Klebsiella quasipneumoniae subsp. quasipneumoniae]